MCELREARLDEEDAAGEVSKAMDQLKKDRESLAKKERLMDQSLKVALLQMSQYGCTAQLLGTCTRTLSSYREASKQDSVHTALHVQPNVAE